MTRHSNSNDAYYEKQQEIIDDLLAALEGMLNQFSHVDHEIIDQARAAIAKARGE